MSRYHLIFLFVMCSLGSSYTLPKVASGNRKVPAKRWAKQWTTKSDVGINQLNNIRGGAVTAQQAVPVLGTIVTNAMFAAGLPTIQMLREQRSIGPLNVFPFSMVLANCLSWTSYSLYVSDPYIFLSSAPGVILGLYLFSTGLQYGTPAQRRELEVSVIISASIILMSAAVMSMYSPSREKSEQLALGLGSFFSFMYYLAPLSTIRRVFRTKSAASICAPMSFMGFINSMLWFSYGMSLGNATLAVPNGFGALLSLIQLAIVFVFRSGGAPEPFIDDGERFMKLD